MALSLVSRDTAEESRLIALHRFGILDTPSDEAFDRVARLAADVFAAPIVLISFVDDQREWFKSRIGVDAELVPRETSFGKHVVRSSELLIVPDAQSDTRFARNPLVTGVPGVRFYAGAPLVTANSERIGTLSVIDIKPRSMLAPQDRQKLADLAAIVVDQLELRLAVSSLQQIAPTEDRVSFFKSPALAKLRGELEARLNDLVGIAIFLRATRLESDQRDDVDRILSAADLARQLVRQSPNLV